jgi:hypothetical protein
MTTLKEQIIKLYSEGKSYKQIQAEINCSLSSINYYINPEGKTKNDKRRKKNRNLYKQECRDILGAKCMICGYNKCQNALHFHHIDPKTKSFTVSDAFARKTYSQEEVEAEIKKCVLVCANCHTEIHAELIKL